MMYDESSDARNKTVFAISSGFPQRFTGIWLVIASPAAFNTSSGNPILPHNGVPIAPGLMALTLIPLSTNSDEATLTTERNAALLALNRLLPPKPILFNHDVVIIIEL